MCHKATSVGCPEPVLTTAVGAEVATLEPATLVAFTPTLSVWPTSADVTRYEVAVAEYEVPAIPMQFAPLASHRFHR
jgi:hypothetical protein